jgi:hypothetical protein
MKVCVHANYGPFNNGFGRYDTMAQALDMFRVDLRALGIDSGDGEHYTLDFYPQCEECNSLMCFHDYPMARYELGPRGGMRRVTV